jgi:hypothetical protein
MKNFLSIVLLMLALVSAGYAQDEKYEGDGEWAVFEYSEDTVLILSLGIFRENPDEGARPTFMINNHKNGCYASFGLLLFEEDIPKQLSKKNMMEGLKNIIEQSDILADDEILTKKDSPAQVLDMGKFIYARILIDSDVLAAFMLSKEGAIRIKNQDAIIGFSMFGFEKTINRLVESRCKS